MELIEGFSKKNKQEKLEAIGAYLSQDPAAAKKLVGE